MGVRAVKRRKDQPWNPPSSGPDISTVFVLFAAGPLLLPVLGANPVLIAYATCLAVSAYATVRCWGASRRGQERRRAWLLLGAATAIAAAACVTGLGTLLGLPEHLPAYVGIAASVALLAGMAAIARSFLRGVRFERLTDALLLGLVLAGAGIFFVVRPGFGHGDALLTTVFLIDLAAVLAGALSLVASTGPRRRIALSLFVAAAVIAVGDGLVVADAAAQAAIPVWVLAALWAVGTVALAVAASHEDGWPGEAPAGRPARWMYARVLAPLAAVCAFPAMGFAVWLAGAADRFAVAYFGGACLLLLGLVLWRQAWVLADHERAIERERGLRAEVMRRNDDLEALTELATTMTETLEEAPIVERGLGVLHLAGRATSAAVHVYRRDGGADLAASAGAWPREGIWAGAPPAVEDAAVQVRRRGGRDILRLPIVARGTELAVVTLIRGEDQPFRGGEVELLRVLSDQLAIAIQNARDYREKLEQAVRDPLTGLYNRRYFFEALDKEVRRAQRYGSHASLVLFDVDNFKKINDTLGHQVGDEVLREIAETVEGLIRDVDSFARVGGEEFALLLPQTQQLDALLVAERVRAAIARRPILPGRRVTVSGGVASCPLDASTLDDLERRADAALYWAKANGRNLCALASEAQVQEPERKDDAAASHLYPLVSSIDARHLHTRDHSENVAAYAVAIAQELALEPDRTVRLRRAALFHDIGKLAVDSAILEKPGGLTDEEYAQIRLHPDVGARMLQHAGLTEEAAWVRAHHERLDGRGYPAGLAGDEIPLEARIIFVADAFEAMTSDRPYRAGIPTADALAELSACAGSQFDPDVVAALERLVGRGALEVLALKTAELSG